MSATTQITNRRTTARPAPDAPLATRTRPGTTAPASHGDPGRLSRATMLASSTLTIMAAALIAPSLPEMRQVFAGVAAADVLVRLALTTTSLVIGVTAPLAGAVADRVGRKPVLVSSLLLYAGAGVAGVFVTDLVVLLGARALLGIAVGGVMTSVSAMITDWFTGRRRSAFLGLQAAFANLGGVVFLPLAGVMAGVAWNVPFWLYAASLLVVPFAVLAVRESRPRTASATPSSSRPASPMAGPDAPAEANTPSASGRGRLLIAGIYGVALFGTLVFFMAPTQLPFSLQQYAVSPAVVGVVVAGSTVTSAVAALRYTWMAARLDRSAITALSLALLGAGWVVIGTAGALVQVVAGVLLGGIGVGLIVPNLNLWLSELVPAAQRGRALGGLVSAIFLGQFLSPLLLQPIVSTLGADRTFLVTGAVCVAGALALALVPARRGSRGRLPPPSAGGDTSSNDEHKNPQHRRNT